MTGVVLQGIGFSQELPIILIFSHAGDEGYLFDFSYAGYGFGHRLWKKYRGVHDFYSEGDYWWPDYENPNEPTFVKTE